MIRSFVIQLIITLALAAMLVTVSINMGITGKNYLDLTVPWWHVVLHVAVLMAAFVTSLTGVTMWIDWRSRRVSTHNPPQQA